MKKFILKSLATLLVLTFIISCASLSLSALTYVSGKNSVSDSYKGGKYYKQLTSIPLSGNQRADALAVALSQVQYMESNSSKDLAGTTGGSNNYTEYCYNYGYDVGTNYAWCAAFMTWVLRQAGVNKQGTGSANAARNHLGDSKYIYCEISCGYWVSQLKQCGYWQASAGRGNGTYTPKPGDLIFFENGGDAWADHIGMVVYTSGSTVYTIEGNTSGASGVVANGGRVAFKSYNYKTSTYILGYGALPYNTSTSPIDYSIGTASTRTTGLYINPESAKYLYSSSSMSGSYVVLPKGTLFEVTGIVSGTVLKCKYNGNTYYINNNSDRIIQLTQTGTTSNGSSSDSSSGTTSNICDTFAANIHHVSSSQLSVPTTINDGLNVTANQLVINPVDFGSAEATTLWVSGWCALKGAKGTGNQTNDFEYSVDGGTTWKSVGSVTTQNYDDADLKTTIITLSGDSTWTGSYGDNEMFALSVDLSSYKGQTVDVMLRRQAGNSSNLKNKVHFTTITNVKVGTDSSSGGSSSGGTTSSGLTPTTSYMQYALIDYINGVGPKGDSTAYSSDHVATRGNPASMVPAKQTTDGTLSIKGWCMINGGQGNVVYSVDGGTTWLAVASSTYTSGSEAHKTAASGGGVNFTYPVYDNVCFDVSVDLSAYNGQTLDVMFARVVSNNEALVSHFLTVSNVVVSNGTTSSTPSISGTPALSGTSATTNTIYHANIGSINGNNNYTIARSDSTAGAGSQPIAVVGTNLYSVATGVTVGSNKTVTISGWLVMKGGVSQYVYSLDGTNWYKCGGSPTDGTAEVNLATAAGTFLASANVTASMCPSANVSFQDNNGITIDLSGCAGNTVTVYLGVVGTENTSEVTKFLELQNISVPDTSATSYPMAGVINYINGIGPDGTIYSNYSSELVALQGTWPTIPKGNAINSDNTVRVSGWCMIDGGQKEVIKWSVDAKTWYNCSASFTNGTQDHITAVTTWNNMINPSVSGANFEAVANLSGVSVTADTTLYFGRESSDGQTYAFLSLTNLVSNDSTSTCSHSETYLSGKTDAKCGIDGYTGDTICSSCGQTISYGSKIDALEHVWKNATCKEPKTCTLCGLTDGDVGTHSYSYQYSDTQHWQECSVCGTTTDKTAHTYTSGVCKCGKADPTATKINYYANIDWLNGQSFSASGSGSKGIATKAYPLSYRVNILEIRGWVLLDNATISGYKWSVDGVIWNDCTIVNVESAQDAHKGVANAGGVTNITSLDNAVFGNTATRGIYADLTKLGEQTVTVQFAAVTSSGVVVPFAEVTDVTTGITKNPVGKCYDEYYIGGTAVGFTDATIGSVSVSNVDKANGTLSISGLYAGTSVTLRGWIGYKSPISKFGYYFDNYTATMITCDAVTPEDAVTNAGGQYAKRMQITANTASLSGGTHTLTFVAVMEDGSTLVLTSWTVNVVEPSSAGTGSAITGSSGQANVIILAGQSNAYGASPTNDKYNIGSTYNDKTFSNVKIRFRNINAVADSTDTTGGYKWKILRENSNFQQYNVKVAGENELRFGPELGLAKYLEEKYPGEEFYIIKFTAAGTLLNGQWFAADANGMDNWGLVSDMGAYLYDQMKAYVTESIGMIKASTNKQVVIQSFMWVQGESDSGSPGLASSYQAYEQLLVNSVRADFAEYSVSSGISFVDYAISEKNEYGKDTKMWPYGTELNNSKRANAQFNYSPTAGEQGVQVENATYGISKSILLDYTQWETKAEAGFDTDTAHLSGGSMLQLGQWLGLCMDSMNGHTVTTHTHTEETITGKSATCTESGLTTGIKCSTCGTILVEQEIILATGHNVDANGNCTNSGCDYSTGSSGCSHTYTEGQYSTDGNSHWYVCTLCNEKINVETHKYDNACDTDCNVCGYVRVTEHSIVKVDGREATCLQTGLTDGYKCGICGYVQTEQTVIAKLKHSYSITESKDPTCTTRGYDLYTCANGCGKSYKTTTPSLGHNYVDTVTNATCTSMGYTTHTCENCKESYVDTYVPATNHNYIEETVNATCTTVGYTIYKCECGSSYNGEIIPATGHNYEEITVGETCTTRGYTEHKCSGCGATYKTDFVSAKGHNYVDTTVEATCTTRGYTNHKCSCGAEYNTDYVQPKGHDYQYTIEDDKITVSCPNCDSSYWIDNSKSA